MKLSKYLTKPCSLHVTDHDGKLAGIPSINVSTDNPICNRLAAIPGSVCSKCYARRMESYRLSLAACLRSNAAILDKPIDSNDMPTFKSDVKIARFDSFGEVASLEQWNNYMAIAEANPSVVFALWTKRDDLVQAYGAVPTNVVLIYSHLPLFNAGSVPATPSGYDYSYAVYDKGQGVGPCGAECITCRRCYTKPEVKGAVIKQLVH